MTAARSQEPPAPPDAPDAHDAHDAHDADAVRAGKLRDWAGHVRTIALVLAIAAAVISLETWRRNAAALDQISVDSGAPVTALNLLDGSQTSLTDLRGSVVLVVFWATWCPPCVHEIPTLRTLHQELGGRGLVVIGVNEDESPPGFVKGFVEKSAIPYKVALDADGAVARVWGLQAMPSLAVVDREGRVRWKTEGLTSESKLRSVIEPLL